MTVTTLDMIYRGTRNIWAEIPQHKMADRLSSLEQKSAPTDETGAEYCVFMMMGEQATMWRYWAVG